MKNILSNLKNLLPTQNSLRIINTLIRKELFSFFSTPLAYIILALFIGVVSILFFAVGRFLQVGTADLSGLFGYISFAFVIIIPALTMGSISKEKQSGTIEYLLTQPITEFQLLISKFLAYGIFVLLLLATTLPLVIMIGINAPLDYGQVVMQYIGAFVLGLSLVSLGIAISAFLKSEIASFLTTLVLAAVLIVIGSEIVQIRFGLDFILERIGLLSHYQSISRGVLDVRDVLYFIAFIVAFLSISFFLLIKDKFPAKHKHLRYSKIALVILIILTLFIGYIGQLIPGRIDFTSNKIYTLSDSTVSIIQNVGDVLNLKLYASNNLPIEFQSQIRNVQDLLRDYQAYSRGKINYEFIQPSSSTDEDNPAQQAGLQPIQFQVNSSDSSQFVVGYFGVTLSYLDKNETLNLNDQTIINALEYNLTKKVNKLTNKNLKSIGFVNEGVTYTLGSENLTTLSTELNELFNVKEVNLNESIAEDIEALIIAGPSAQISEENQAKILSFYENGGGVLFMSNPVSVNSQTFAATNNENSLREIFSELGVTINQNLVYDLENNNLVNAGYLFPINYPLWITSSATSEDLSVLKDVDQVSYLWGSDISIDNAKLGEARLYRLLETSDDSNVQTNGGYNLAPDQNWGSKEGDGSRTLAVALEKNNGGKLIVVGDSKLFTDDFGLIQMGENLAFGISSIEWLSGSDSIANIQAKVRAAPSISLSAERATALSVIGIAFPIILIITIGGFRFYLRKRKQEKKFVI